MKKPARNNTTTEDSKLVGEAVSSKLKAYYDEISNEDVPERFLDLLAQLDAGSPDKNGSA